jgi:hypothetical protein
LAIAESGHWVIDDPAACATPASRVSRWVFRLAAVYFSLYVLTTQMLGSLLPLPVGNVPELGALPPVRTIVAWAAAHVFRVTSPLVVTGSGSGDKTFDWVHAFCVLVISVLVTAVWSTLDRLRTDDARLDKWFRLFARFALGSTMVSYGMVKAIPMQMPSPSLTRLLEPYGFFSPMGVLWASVGASRAYEIVIGFAELAGGVLLFVPQTAPLGALICLFDTIQIFILNMTYDVPVKLFAFHLIVLSLLLLAPQIPQLFHVLVPGSDGKPSTDSQVVPSLRPRRLLVVAQIVFGIYIVAINLYGARQAWGQYGGGAPKSPLYGIWNVDQMSIDGQIRSPLITDYDRWRRVIFDRPGAIAFQRMNDTVAFYGVAVDTSTGTITPTQPADVWKSPMRFQRSAPDRLTLDGEMSRHRLHMELRLLDRNSFLLVTRGFHWVQEYPFNR